VFSCGGAGSDASTLSACFAINIGKGIAWEPIASLQVGRYYHSLSAVGDKLVVAGGFDLNLNPLNSVEIFQAGTWTTPSWQLKEHGGGHCVVVASNTTIIQLGGVQDQASSDKVWKIDITKGEIAPIPAMPEKVGTPGCYDYHHRLIYSGGKVDMAPSNKVWEFKRQEKRWVPLPSLLQGRDSHTMFSLGDRLHVAGGFDVNNSPIRTVERLTEDESTWELVQPSLLQGSGAAPIVVI